VYAASTASIMPYASLAAVRGGQAAVMAYRVLEAGVALSGVAVLVLLAPSTSSWVPYAMSLGSFAGGAAVRAFVLVPLASPQGRPRTLRQLRRASVPDRSTAVPGPRMARAGSALQPGGEHA
jgi:hypothetical protein